MKIFLKPGEIYVGKRHAEVATVLGSCASVTMFSPRFKLGAICHALPPCNPRSTEKDIFRYVDTSILYVLGAFEGIGIRGRQLEIKLLGGADVLERINGNAVSIGMKNIETALRILHDKDLEVTEADVGGNRGRKVRFYTDTGGVLSRRIGRIPRGSIL